MDSRAPIISWSTGMSSSPSEDSVAEECNHDDNDHNNHAKDLISSGSEGGESTNRDETITPPITTPLVDVKTKATMPGGGEYELCVQGQAGVDLQGQKEKRPLQALRKLGK